MKILCFGSCSINHIHYLKKVAAKMEIVATNSMMVDFGGKGFNQAIALARAGVNVSFAGSVGEEFEQICEIAQANNVETLNLYHSEETTGQAFIQEAENGESNAVIYGGANMCITKEYVDEVLGFFGKGDVIILQNEINNVPYIIDSAFKRGIKIVLNPSPFNDRMKQIDFNKIDYLILNEIEALHYFNINSTIGIEKNLFKIL